jgi:hypothetical protein
VLKELAPSALNFLCSDRGNLGKYKRLNFLHELKKETIKINIKVLRFKKNPTIKRTKQASSQMQRRN